MMEPAAITAIGGAIVLVIAAFAAAVVKIIIALKGIHILVNSKMQAALDEISRVSTKLAELTGTEADEKQAAAAQKAAGDDWRGKIQVRKKG